MRVSLNEVETIAAKAARGAGYPWGLAEEAGMACRWLARYGFDWAGPLVRLLQRTLAREPFSERSPLDQGWLPPPHCPLRLGAYISDRGCYDFKSGVLVAEPILLLPFLARPGRIQGLSIAGPRFGPTKPIEVHLVGEQPVADDWSRTRRDTAEGDRQVYIAALKRLPSEASPVLAHAHERSSLGDGLRTALARFEALTYVPASDHSRLAGAGAGLDDND
jgi:hypothetical protein